MPMRMSLEKEYTESELFFLAKLAEQTERYADNIHFMKSLVHLVSNESQRELTVEERNLLAVAYKNGVGAKRASWRIITALSQKEAFQVPAKQCLLDDYKNKIEEELEAVCNDILALLSILLQNSSTQESKVFFHKMCGDYNRYIAEFSIGEKKEQSTKCALSGYKLAEECALAALDTTHPLRLGLALNFSVFYYEIIGDERKACEIARTAFDEAIQGLEKIHEESYKDSTLIMQLLRDNLMLWTAEEPKDNTEEPSL